MHQALYRKWRPKSFDDVYGQEHITSILKYEAKEGNLSHAYLFCGSRGTGKTTCAKILAKVANCENPKDGNPCGECAACRAIDAGSATDVLEMDAASNNGVDNIRDIRDEVSYPPTVLKYRVYIVDEVHMLSDSAFNALLKTLEEPPAYVIFILATTELHALPATIVSRCQRFEFRRIAVETLMKRLSDIAKAEKIQITDGALRLVAKLAEGGMRDAISLLELCTGGRRDDVIDEDKVAEIVGISGRESLSAVAQAIAEKNFEVLFREIGNVTQSAKDISVFWQDLLSFYRDMLVYKSMKNAAEYLDLTDNETARLEKVAGLFTRETILCHCRQLENALFEIRNSTTARRVIAELTLVKMCDETLDSSNEALLSRVSRLEDRIALGLPASPMPAHGQAEEKVVAPVRKIEESKKDASIETKDKPAPEKKVMKFISCWAEVLDRIAGTSGSAAAYLKQAKAYISEDGDISVLVPDAFTMMMIEKGSTRSDVRAALSLCLKKEIPESKLSFELSKAALPDNEDDLILDEILKKAEN